MSLLGPAALAAAFATAITGPVGFRERPLETYYASLSAWDHIDGRGRRLTSVSDILRQDRANYHHRNLRDPSDIGDKYFRKEVNRRQMPALLAAGGMDDLTAQIILTARPRVRVDRYADRMQVTVETDARLR